MQNEQTTTAIMRCGECHGPTTEVWDNTTQRPQILVHLYCPNCGARGVDSGVAESTTTLIRGAISGTHPLWATGEPILWGDDVRTPDGWNGFVTGMHPDEVAVTPYSDDDADYEEFSPGELRLVRLGPAHSGRSGNA